MDDFKLYQKRDSNKYTRIGMEFHFLPLKLYQAFTYSINKKINKAIIQYFKVQADV